MMLFHCNFKILIAFSEVTNSIVKLSYNSVTLTQLQMYQGCLKLQKPRMSMLAFRRKMDGVGRKTSSQHSWKHRKSILNIPSLLDLMCHNCLGRDNTLSRSKSQKTTLTKNQRLNIENKTTSHECFSTCQHKTEQPKTIYIPTSYKQECFPPLQNGYIPSV